MLSRIEHEKIYNLGASSLFPKEVIPKRKEPTMYNYNKTFKRKNTEKALQRAAVKPYKERTPEESPSQNRWVVNTCVCVRVCVCVFFNYDDIALNTYPPWLPTAAPPAVFCYLLSILNPPFQPSIQQSLWKLKVNQHLSDSLSLNLKHGISACNPSNLVAYFLLWWHAYTNNELCIEKPGLTGLVLFKLNWNCSIPLRPYLSMHNQVHVLIICISWITVFLWDQTC